MSETTTGSAPAPRAGPESDRLVELDGRRYKPFWICGHGKSGTNWVGSLLRLHPEVHVVGEFHFQYMRDALRSYFDMRHVQGRESRYREALDQGLADLMVRVLLAARFERPTAWCIADQSPRQLRVLVPRTPHVYVLRDGRDVIVSLAYHALAMKNRGEVISDLWTLYDRLLPVFHRDEAGAREAATALLSNAVFLRWSISRWAEWVTGDLGVIDEVERSGEARVLVVRYEQLHESTERERRRMYEFLGVDPAHAAPLGPGTRAAARSSRPSGGIRKGIVGDWRNHAQDAFCSIFKELAGDILVRLGYAADGHW